MTGGRRLTAARCAAARDAETRAGAADHGQVTLTPELVAEIVAVVDEALAAVDPAEPVARHDAVLAALPAAKARTDL